jgi:hypothetical protein
MYAHRTLRPASSPSTKSAALLAAEAAFAAPRVQHPAAAAGGTPVVKVLNRKVALANNPVGGAAGQSKAAMAAPVAAPDWSQVLAARFDTGRAANSKAEKSPRVFRLPSSAADAKPKSAASPATALTPKPSSTPLSAPVSAPRKRRARTQPAPVHVIFSAPASEPLVLSAQQEAQLRLALDEVDALFAQIRAAAAFELSAVESASSVALWRQVSAQLSQCQVKLAAYRP